MRRFTLFAVTLALVSVVRAAGSENGWVAATDQARVKRVAGRWSESAYRGAGRGHLETTEDRAAVEFEFDGTGLVVVLESHALSFTHLGEENLGTIAAVVDGHAAVRIEPQQEDRDVVVARGLPSGRHLARLETSKGGVKLCGFRVLQGGEGDLSFLVHGEANRFLVDVRAIVRRGETIVRNVLVRNWLSGQVRLAGLPAGRGYDVELVASGWEPYHLRDIEVIGGRESRLSPVFLRRTRASTLSGVEYPFAGGPAIVKAGGSFATRFVREASPSLAIQLERHVGPALITRRVEWTEDKGRAYDGRSEGVITIPVGTPPGMYDLVFRVTEDGRPQERIAARSVSVVRDFPKDPVFLTFGHMDTWGQEQAEYLDRLAGVANLIAPDMVLVSNETNAAYAAGAYSHFEMPYAITFGGHRVSGQEEWYGRAARIIDFGPGLTVLNFSSPWHGDLTPATALLESRATTPCQIVNAYESDAPVELLDRYRIPYLHDAHGDGARVMKIGSTPTLRAGKENSASFRVVRFEGCRPVSYTYAGHATAAIPMPREAASPLRVSLAPANDGSQTTVTARVVNEWAQDFPNGRVTLVMPKGEYTVDRGRIESTVGSDDGRFVVVSIQLDLAAKATIEVTATMRR